MATAMIPAGGLSKSNSSPVTPRRRFRLLDAMILVAATALACGITLWMERNSNGEISWSAIPDVFHDNHDLSDSAKQREMIYDCKFASALVVLLAMPFAAMWTLALIPIRLTGPRPRFRQLARQPGLMAAFSAGIALALVGGQVGILFWQASPDAYGEIVIAEMATYPGLAVLIAWMTLLVGRRWRAEPNWVDRLGRSLGFFWVVAAVFLTSVALSQIVV